VALPKLTPDEKRRALQKAQEMRSKRAKVREQLKKGTLTLREVLENADDEVVGKMRVAYLLQSLPQVGKVTSQRSCGRSAFTRAVASRGLESGRSGLSWRGWDDPA